MSNDKTGGPAFPISALKGPEFEGERGLPFAYGMTLRDYFAAKAMQGMWANAELLKALDSGMEAEFLENAAYEQADAMLKARQQ